MKAISSSIVVAAGMYGILTAIPMPMSYNFVFGLIQMAAGLVTLSLGLIGWWACLKYDR